MTQTEKISRDDIEAKVFEIESALQGSVDRAKPPLIVASLAMGILVVIVAYIFGRRVGAKRTAIVEVRRY